MSNKNNKLLEFMVQSGTNFFAKKPLKTGVYELFSDFVPLLPLLLPLTANQVHNTFNFVKSRAIIETEAHHFHQLVKWYKTVNSEAVSAVSSCFIYIFYVFLFVPFYTNLYHFVPNETVMSKHGTGLAC